MKKISLICVILVLIVAVGCFASCVNTSDKLREINMALNSEYSKIELNVSTASDEVTLKSKFIITNVDGNTDISYEVECLNGFGTDNSVPSEFISVIKGSAVIKDDAIISIDGGELSQSILLGVADYDSMVFRTAYFGEIKAGSSGISALVRENKKFMQDDNFDGTDMTVDVRMSGSYIKSITINYVLNDSNVSLDYNFTR